MGVTVSLGSILPIDIRYIHGHARFTRTMQQIQDLKYIRNIKNIRYVRIVLEVNLIVIIYEDN